MMDLPADLQANPRTLRRMPRLKRRWARQATAKVFWSICARRSGRPRRRQRYADLGQRANSINVANTESILGGSGADTIVLTTVLNAAANAVDLGPAPTP